MPEYKYDRQKPTCMTCIILLFIIASFPPLVSATTFPQDYNYSQKVEVLLDNGLLWDINSLNHPLETSNNLAVLSTNSRSLSWLVEDLKKYGVFTFNDSNTADNSFKFSVIAGLGVNKQFGLASDFEGIAVNPQVWCRSQFGSGFYALMYLRGTNQVESLDHYTGRSDQIDLNGLNTAEVDQSVLGYRNNWIELEFGRSREVWGYSQENNLLLSGNSPAFDRMAIQVFRKNFSFRYFFGFLECLDLDGINYQRYILGRMIEYSNHKNLIIGISENSVFAGPDRPVDLAMINPLGFHLEADLNGRGNTLENYDNAVWCGYIDWLALKTLRLSASFGIDEFQYGLIDRKNNEADALAYQVRAAWTVMDDPFSASIIIDRLKLWSYFGQHSSGVANYVTRNEFLGNSIGNDAEDYSLALRLVFKEKSFVTIGFGQYKWGDFSMLDDPYREVTDYINLPFPSGEIRSNTYLRADISTEFLKNLIIYGNAHIDLRTSGTDSGREKYILGIIYYPKFRIEY